MSQPERLENARNMAHTITQCLVFVYPCFVVLFTMLGAWLVGVTGSIVGVRAKFRDIFSIMMACSLIASLQYIANYIVLRTKGDEITSQDQMSPRLDWISSFPRTECCRAAQLLFDFPDLVPGDPGVGSSALSGSTKGKAFAAITPAWLVPLIFKIIGSAFSGGVGQHHSVALPTRPIRVVFYSSASIGFLYFGFFRKFFGTMILGDGGVPTRSRARALTSFFALYLLGLRICLTNRLRYTIESLAGCPSSD